MGCDFEFYNATKNIKSVESKYYLFRNIDRGAKSHLKNVILQIIEINKWDIADTIEIKCCCSGSYFFENGILKNNLDPNWEYVQDLCSWDKCPVCNF